VDSIVVRASLSSGWRCCSFSTIDEHQVADVDHQPRPLPDDEDDVALMNRISGRDDSSDDGEIPEDDRDVALALLLGSDPLHDEARSENDLAEETEGKPGLIERHASSFNL